jgi:UDP-N-acetylglucosamine--N-acetylmuramyl-(pentapeptide) pyrophosphoryl-undecaprenol N-acetylglucosamine transferase
VKGLRFVVSGGGTGGHIYPALAIAGGLSAAYPDAEILYIGTAKGMEKEIVLKEQIPFQGITVAGLKRKITLENIKVLFQAIQGFNQAREIIGQWQPRVVIGTGGYVCGPVVLAAALKKIPTLIHEQNAFPGVTNRLLAKVAGCVGVTYAESVKHFSKKARIRLTGLPVRPEILAVNRDESLSRLGYPGDSTVLLSFGGSRGAQSINRAMVEVVKEFGGVQGINLIHITGTEGYQSFLDNLAGAGIVLDSLGNVTIKPYIYKMEEVLAAADLVISRAGATTLAELTALGLPSVLVPYPFAAENHQEHNARALEKEGAALVVLDRELSGKLLCSHITELLNHQEKREAMGAACYRLSKTDALANIIDCVDGLLQDMYHFFSASIICNLFR